MFRGTGDGPGFCTELDGVETNSESECRSQRLTVRLPPPLPSPHLLCFILPVCLDHILSLGRAETRLISACLSTDRVGGAVLSPEAHRSQRPEGELAPPSVQPVSSEA